MSSWIDFILVGYYYKIINNNNRKKSIKEMDDKIIN